jgi:hypothetical protein
MVDEVEYKQGSLAEMLGSLFLGELPAGFESNSWLIAVDWTN